MLYHQAYLKINWPQLNESGIRKDGKTLIADYEGCELLRAIRCPFTLAVLIHIAAHDKVSVVSRDDMFKQFYGQHGDNRGNSDYFDMVLDRLVNTGVLILQD